MAQNQLQFHCDVNLNLNIQRSLHRTNKIKHANCRNHRKWYSI